MNLSLRETVRGTDLLTPPSTLEHRLLQNPYWVPVETTVRQWIVLADQSKTEDCLSL